MKFFLSACLLEQTRECAGILLPTFRLFSFFLLTRNVFSQNRLKSVFREVFPPNTINCSSFCENRRHRRGSAFLGDRKRIPRTSVSSSFTFPFLNAEFSLVCGIPFFFLFLFPKNKKADEERRREEGIPFFKRSTREKTGGKTKRKAKTREKTKNEKELRLRNIVRDAFFSSLDRSFFFPPSSRKKGKKKGAHQPSFFSSVVKEKKKTPLA